ncbi:hypothetical protein FJZ36_13270 [Candidatus Poribacteria bacterium]|nr:hypothetical protein [Candidatus Poribacteria bacterium]
MSTDASRRFAAPEEALRRFWIGKYLLRSLGSGFASRAFGSGSTDAWRSHDSTSSQETAGSSLGSPSAAGFLAHVPADDAWTSLLLSYLPTVVGFSSALMGIGLLLAGSA